ncbi:MAG TPA: DUF4085 family protein [Clostridiaceae bacterium]|nr:DUF4085 family protein [Clostridiaceae bacterium]
MKYYTKEWYALMQKVNMTACYEPIPDKNYTDQDILKLYEQKLRAEIEIEHIAYDTPPSMPLEELLGDESTFDSENFLFEDSETGRFYHPETLAEARAVIENNQRELMEAFEHRLPFDSTQTQVFFEDNYKYMLEDDFQDLPSWVLEKVDKRLLALGLLPNSIYKQVLQEEIRVTAQFEAINGEAEELLANQEIPDEIKERFYFHDAGFISITQEGKDISFILRMDGIWDVSPFVRIRFKNLLKLDKEEGLVINLLRDEDSQLYSNTYYLYEELYRISEGYEAHFLISSEEDLKYLTIVCEDIEIEEDVDLREEPLFNS